MVDFAFRYAWVRRFRGIVDGYIRLIEWKPDRRQLRNAKAASGAAAAVTGIALAAFVKGAMSAGSRRGKKATRKRKWSNWD